MWANVVSESGRSRASRRPWRLRVALYVVALLVLVAPAAFAQLPPALEQWMHYEQRLLSRQLDTTRIRALDNHQDPRYAPEQAQTFEVESYWLDADSAHFFTADTVEPALRSTFVRTVNGRQQVRLIVHPESRAFYRDVIAHAERGENLVATATASSRTLLVWPRGQEANAFFAKVSLDQEIGGVRRTIPSSEVARSIGTARVLEHEPNMPASFLSLPEEIGIIPRGMERGGMIIRGIPREVREGRVRYVPLFSLYARGPHGEAPMLTDMIRESGLPAERFVREHLVRPFVRQWTDLAVRHGITSEPHAQNVLLEVGRDGQPTGRFVQRDFGGFDIDFPFREQAGMPRPADLPRIGTFEHDYHVDAEDRFTKLETFFEGGFLHNLDQNMPQWEREGLVPPGSTPEGGYSRVLSEEVDGALGAMGLAQPASQRGVRGAIARSLRAARGAYARTMPVPNMVMHLSASPEVASVRAIDAAPGRDTNAPARPIRATVRARSVSGRLRQMRLRAPGTRTSRALPTRSPRIH